MTCCIVALALAWQLIRMTRWLCTRLGFAPRERTAPSGIGVIAANVALAMRRPSLRVALLTVLMLEASAAGAYVFSHRNHIGNEIAYAVFDATGYAADLCTSLLGGD